MNPQVPRPYIVAVVAFALLIPLWVVVAGRATRAGTAAPDSTTAADADQKKTPPPEPAKEIVVRVINETDSPVQGTVRWQGSDPNSPASLKSGTLEFVVEPRSASKPLTIPRHGRPIAVNTRAPSTVVRPALEIEPHKGDPPKAYDIVYARMTAGVVNGPIDIRVRPK